MLSQLFGVGGREGVDCRLTKARTSINTPLHLELTLVFGKSDRFRKLQQRTSLLVFVSTISVYTNDNFEQDCRFYHKQNSIFYLLHENFHNVVPM